MKQITVRGLDDKLSESIRQLAEKKGISLSKAALHMLYVGAGLPPPPTPKKGPIGNSLDKYSLARWSQEEFDELNLRSLKRISTKWMRINVWK